jgi:RNA polymerase sigma factor (sigma-70 family)
LTYITGNQERAEDVFQETWIRVLERGHLYDGKYKFESWLFTIARNLVIDWQRHKKSQSLEALIDPDEGAPMEFASEDDASPLNLVLLGERGARIRASLGQTAGHLSRSAASAVSVRHQARRYLARSHDTAPILEIPAVSRTERAKESARRRRRMNEELHFSAEEPIARQRVEGISEAERVWFEEHLWSCAQCAEVARATEQAIHSLRGLSVLVPRKLASRTQFRVRLRAREMQARGPRWEWLWAACGVSWAFGAATAPYAWRGLEWLGHRAELPDMVWKMGFGVLWVLPAIVVVVVLLLEKTGETDGDAFSRRDLKTTPGNSRVGRRKGSEEQND